MPDWCRWLRVFILVLSCSAVAAARDLAVVSNKTNSINSIAMPDFVKVCKAQMSRWPDGKPVTFVMRAPALPEMKMLLEKVYAMSETEVNDLIATANHGRNNHPAIVIATSDEDLINKVASMPGAVGIVDVYAINSSVQVVKLAGKLPFEPGYPLHGN